MTPQPDYKTRKDGSIDYGYYITCSHALRSQEAHGALRGLKQAIAAILRIRSKWPVSTAEALPA